MSVTQGLENIRRGAQGVTKEMRRARREAGRLARARARQPPPRTGVRRPGEPSATTELATTAYEEAYLP